MDCLASSHTVDSPTSRLLLIMFFVVVLGSQSSLPNGCYVFADTSASGIIEDDIVVDFVSVSDNPDHGSLPRMRIGNVQPGANGLRQRKGSAQAEALIVPRAPQMQCSNRALLADISPPGMWPPGTDDQDSTPTLPDEFRRRSLLTGDISHPPSEAKLGPWLTFETESAHDGEDAFLRGALAVDIWYPHVQWPAPSMVDKLKCVENVLKKALLAKCKWFPSALSKVNSMITEESVLQSKSQERADSERQVGPGPIPETGLVATLSTTGHELRPSTDHADVDSDIVQQINHSKLEALDSPGRRVLQADNSPPGMWPDDDDQTQFSDSLLVGRRRLLNLGAISRLGMWQVSDDADSFQRRVLLADILPPGLWLDFDDRLTLDHFLEFPDNL